MTPELIPWYGWLGLGLGSGGVLGYLLRWLLEPPPGPSLGAWNERPSREWEGRERWSSEHDVFGRGRDNGLRGSFLHERDR
jgi:hypothetical protein